MYTLFITHSFMDGLSQGRYATSVPLLFSVVPPTLQSYDIATELVTRGVAVWSTIEEGEGEGRREGEEEEGDEEEKKEGGDKEEEEEEEEDEGEAEWKEEKMSDEGDGNEKEKEEEEEGEETQAISLEFDSGASDEGGEDSMGVVKKEVPASRPPQAGRHLAGTSASADSRDALRYEVQCVDMSYVRRETLLDCSGSWPVYVGPCS